MRAKPTGTSQRYGPAHFHPGQIRDAYGKHNQAVRAQHDTQYNRPVRPDHPAPFVGGGRVVVEGRRRMGYVLGGVPLRARPMAWSKPSAMPRA